MEVISGNVFAKALSNMKGMELMPKKIAEKIPPLYSQEAIPDPICHVKYFDVCGSWNWYVIEFDAHERLCYGFVHGCEDELGYFSLAELEELGAGIERDLYFKPKPLSVVREGFISQKQ